MENYSALKRNEVLSHEKTWTNLEYSIGKCKKPMWKAAYYKTMAIMQRSVAVRIGVGRGMNRAQRIFKWNPKNFHFYFSETTLYDTVIVTTFANTHLYNTKREP